MLEKSPDYWHSPASQWRHTQWRHQCDLSVQTFNICQAFSSGKRKTNVTARSVFCGIVSDWAGREMGWRGAGWGDWVTGRSESKTTWWVEANCRQWCIGAHQKKNNVPFLKVFWIVSKYMNRVLSFSKINSSAVRKSRHLNQMYVKHGCEKRACQTQKTIIIKTAPQITQSFFSYIWHAGLRFLWRGLIS